MSEVALGVPVSLLLAWLGVRLLVGRNDERGLPDRLVGLFFLCLGLGAFPALTAPNPRVVRPDLAPIGMAVGHGIVSVGFAALYLFVWRCFGPDTGWRRALAIAGADLLLLLWLAQGWFDRFSAPGGWPLHAASALRGLALVWAFGETVRYQALMRRRLAIGLADPIVANRFLLWSAWTGSLLLAITTVVTARALDVYGPETSSAIRLPIVLTVLSLGLTSAGSLWLAFFPPRWFVAWLLGDGAPTEG